MALPATDSFTYSTGTLSTVSGGAWADSSSAQKVKVNGSGQATYDSVAGDCLAYWVNDSFTADQYSQATVTAVAYAGMAVRVTASGNGYVSFVSGVPPGNYSLQKDVAGTRTNLATWDFVSGHQQYLSAVGTTLEMKDNGTSKGTTTDSTFASGAPGIFLYNGGSGIIDDWTGDTIPTGGGGGGGTMKRSSTLSLLGVQ